MVVYYAIALGLYMQSSYREVLRCLLEGVQWLLDPAVTLKVAGNSGISQARTRLAETVDQRYLVVGRNEPLFHLEPVTRCPSLIVSLIFSPDFISYRPLPVLPRCSMRATRPGPGPPCAVRAAARRCECAPALR